MAIFASYRFHCAPRRPEQPSQIDYDGLDGEPGRLWTVHAAIPRAYPRPGQAHIAVRHGAGLRVFPLLSEMEEVEAVYAGDGRCQQRCAGQTACLIFFGGLIWWISELGLVAVIPLVSPNSLFPVVYGWWMVAVQAFNGAGDTATPTKINLVFFWLIQIPLSYYLAIVLGWQQSGVFWGVFVSETSVGLFTLWLFSRGRWKTAQV